MSLCYLYPLHLSLYLLSWLCGFPLRFSSRLNCHWTFSWFSFPFLPPENFKRMFYKPHKTVMKTVKLNTEKSLHVEDQCPCVIYPQLNFIMWENVLHLSSSSQISLRSRCQRAFTRLHDPSSPSDETCKTQTHSWATWSFSEVILWEEIYSAGSEQRHIRSMR